MHFKKTPSTHKLGVLYVVDNVTRKWLDQAKLQGQTISSTAPDGTFAAGVHRVTELMPILMNDIIATAPEDQKVRIHAQTSIDGRVAGLLHAGCTDPRHGVGTVAVAAVPIGDSDSSRHRADRPHSSVPSYLASSSLGLVAHLAIIL